MDSIVKTELEKLRAEIIAEADTQDMHAQGEILAGNKYKEDCYRSTAAGLRMAMGMINEHLDE